MSTEQQRLSDLATRFFGAFNTADKGAAMAFFANNAVYEDNVGGRHEGKEAISAAFAAIFSGELGKVEFVTEDLFVDTDAGKVMVRFLCNMELEGKPAPWRGVDLLYFNGDKIVTKMAYSKATEMLFEE